MTAYPEPATLLTGGRRERLAAHLSGPRIDTRVIPDRDEQHPGRDWDAWALRHGYVRTNPGGDPAHYIQVARCSRSSWTWCQETPGRRAPPPTRSPFS